MYDFLKEYHLKEAMDRGEGTRFKRLLIANFVSLLATFPVYPMDTLRRSLQI